MNPRAVPSWLTLATLMSKKWHMAVETAFGAPKFQANQKNNVRATVHKWPSHLESVQQEVLVIGSICRQHFHLCIL